MLILQKLLLAITTFFMPYPFRIQPIMTLQRSLYYVNCQAFLEEIMAVGGLPSWFGTQIFSSETGCHPSLIAQSSQQFEHQLKLGGGEIQEFPEGISVKVNATRLVWLTDYPFHMPYTPCTSINIFKLNLLKM